MESNLCGESEPDISVNTTMKNLFDNINDARRTVAMFRSENDNLLDLYGKPVCHFGGDLSLEGSEKTDSTSSLSYSSCSPVSSLKVMYLNNDTFMADSTADMTSGQTKMPTNDRTENDQLRTNITLPSSNIPTKSRNNIGSRSRTSSFTTSVRSCDFHDARDVPFEASNECDDHKMAKRAATFQHKMRINKMLRNRANNVAKMQAELKSEYDAFKAELDEDVRLQLQQNSMNNTQVSQLFAKFDELTAQIMTLKEELAIKDSNVHIEKPCLKVN